MRCISMRLQLGYMRESFLDQWRAYLSYSEHAHYAIRRQQTATIYSTENITNFSMRSL